MSKCCVMCEADVMSKCCVMYKSDVKCLNVNVAPWGRSRGKRRRAWAAPPSNVMSCARQM